MKRFKNVVLMSLLAATAFVGCGKTDPRGIVYPAGEQTQALYQMMKDIDEIFEKEGVEYFAEGGTLLGAIRHKGLIPWDDDVDIVVLPGSEADLEKTAGVLDQYGYVLEDYWFGKKIYQKGRSGQLPWIDVFYMTEKSGKYSFIEGPNVWGHRDGEPIFYNHSELFPIKRCAFSTFHVNCANQAEVILDAMYGTSWNIQGAQGDLHDRKGARKRFDLLPEDYQPAPLLGPLLDRVK